MMTNSITMTLARIMLALMAVGAFAGTALADEPKQHEEKVKEEAASEDVTKWSLSAGAGFNGGNTRSWQVTAGTDLALIRGRYGFEGGVQFNYGQASLLTEDPNDATKKVYSDMQDVVKNLNSRLRYDFFLTDDDAIFAAAKHRWDTFANLDTRLQIQVGYMRNIFKEEKQRFWGEVGYDLTYDIYSTDQDDGVIHSIRGFVGYTNNLYDNVQFETGLEALINLNEVDGPERVDPTDANSALKKRGVAEDTRVNFHVALRSTIVERLQIELKYRLQFDNSPAAAAFGSPDLAKADHSATVSAIFTMI